MSNTVNLLQPVYTTDTYNNNARSSSNKVSASDDKLIGYTENGTSMVTGTSTNKDMFLQLLVAQMSNLDPFGENQDPTQYITQLAQFSTLEEMQTMSASLENLAALNNGLLVNSAVSTASNFLGKNAEFLVPGQTNSDGTITDATTFKGRVESVFIENGLVYLDVTLDNGEVKSFPYDNLIKVIA